MKPQKEHTNWKLLTFIFFIAFVIVFFVGIEAVKEHKVKYQQGYLNGTLDTQMEINNNIIYGLATYGEYRSRVIYQNQSIPVRCEVIQ